MCAGGILGYSDWLPGKPRLGVSDGGRRRQKGLGLQTKYSGTTVFAETGNPEIEVCSVQPLIY